MDPHIPIIPIMEKNMEHEMEIGAIKELYRHPGMQRVPILGPTVCKYYLHPAIRIPRDLETLNPKSCKALKCNP